MWWHKKPSPKNLEEWLEIATKGIVPLEAEAIAREIRSHYQDELEFQMSYGKAQAEAEKIALVDLGNAYKANTTFCKSHITEIEWMTLCRADGTSPWLPFFNVFLMLGCSIYALSFTFAQLSVFMAMRSLLVLVRLIYLREGKILKALKYCQRLNLVFYPVGYLTYVFIAWLNGKEILFSAIFFSPILIYFVFQVQDANGKIAKFTRFIKDDPFRLHLQSSE